VLYLAGLAAAAAAVVRLDWSTSEVANQLTLLALVVCAFALGTAAPRRAWVAGLALGGCVAAAHAAYQGLHVALPYPTSPRGWAGPATLLLLLLPGFVAAYAGAGVRVLASRPD
jgi:hypothetical protein